MSNATTICRGQPGRTERRLGSSTSIRALAANAIRGVNRATTTLRNSGQDQLMALEGACVKIAATNKLAATAQTRNHRRRASQPDQSERAKSGLRLADINKISRRRRSTFRENSRIAKHHISGRSITN